MCQDLILLLGCQNFAADGSPRNVGFLPIDTSVSQDWIAFYASADHDQNPESDLEVLRLVSGLF